MPLYIVRSRSTRPTASLSFAATRLAPAARDQQIRDVARARVDDPTELELRRWMKDAKGTVRAVPKRAAPARVSGTALVEMSAEEASRLARELPGVAVIPDQPIHLIQPRRGARTRASVAAGELWHLGAIGLDAAHRAGFRGTGEGVTVAVLDTGIDGRHPEIRGRVARSLTFEPGQGAVPQKDSIDTDGHGTHVAGLVAGAKVGVAPGARLVNGIMIPNGFGNLSDFVVAVEWAASDPEIQIVNMSAGIQGLVRELLPAAVEDLLAVGVLPVMAVGNEGRNRTRSPGNYDAVLSVGASNVDGRVASFSSSGVIVIGGHQYSVPDLVAPGEGVTSCVTPQGYEAWDGTSMATPVVSGVAALALQRWPTIAVPDLLDELLRSCVDLGEPRVRQGAGQIAIPKGLLPEPAPRKRKPNPKRRKRAPAKPHEPGRKARGAKSRG